MRTCSLYLDSQENRKVHEIAKCGNLNGTHVVPCVPPKGDSPGDAVGGDLGQRQIGPPAKKGFLKVPKSHVQSYKQYTNNRQSKSPCGGKDFRPNMCPYGMEKSPVKKPEMCIPSIQEGRIGWFIAKTQTDNSSKD